MRFRNYILLEDPMGGPAPMGGPPMGDPMGGGMGGPPAGGMGGPPMGDPMGGGMGGPPAGGMGGPPMGDPMGGPPMGGGMPTPPEPQPIPQHADVWTVLDSLLSHKPIEQEEKYKKYQAQKSQLSVQNSQPPLDGPPPGMGNGDPTGGMAGPALMN